MENPEAPVIFLNQTNGNYMCIYVYIHIYIYVYIYIFIRKAELIENDKIRLFPANGKQKTEVGFPWSANDKWLSTCPSKVLCSI